MSAILLTHPSAELYGADRTLLQIVQAIAERRDRVASGAEEASIRTPERVVVALPRRGVLADLLEAAGATVEVGELGAALRADLHPRRFGAFMVKARRGAQFVQHLIQRHGIDVVHTNTTVLVGAAFGASRSSAHHIWHVHEILDRPSWARHAMRSLIRRLADVTVSNSEATRAAMVDPRMQRSHVVHNGVSEDAARPPRQSNSEVRRTLGVPEDAPLVILPGRINSWKGQDLALASWRKLTGSRGLAAPHLVIAGSPPPGQEHFGQAIDASIQEHGLANRVQRIPFTSDLPSMLAAADLCLVPSTRPEPFGLVAIEAMAMGTPVVAAAHGGLVEIVVDGETGALFQPGCADALAEALVRVLDDDVARSAMGEAARARQRELFTVKRYGDTMLEIYGELLAPWSTRSAA